MSTALVKLRSERDRLSAIERRITDFILENAQLLRDYSSQQLASALGISQSSVVKFCQKLGYKGYPDLKLAVSEAVIRADSHNAVLPHASGTTAITTRGHDLWLRKSEAEETTRLINPPGTLSAVATALGQAGTVFVIGMGEDDLHARTIALRLAQLGILTVHNFDAMHMAASLSAARKHDVLLAFSEHGQQPALCQLAQHMRAQQGQVITVTRHSANALRAMAQQTLLVSAHDEQPHIEPLLYHSALQHLLDRLFIHLYESSRARRSHLQDSLERSQTLLEP